MTGIPDPEPAGHTTGTPVMTCIIWLRALWLHNIRPHRHLLCTAAAGFVAGVLLTLAVTHTGTSETQNNEHNRIAGTTPAPEERPVFDFYTVLPAAHSAGSKQNIAAVNNNPSASLWRKPADTKAKPGAGSLPESKNIPASTNRYALQAASLRDKISAEKLQVQINGWGLETVVQTVTDTRGTTWYRVRTPCRDLQHAGEVRKMLSSHGIGALLIKTT